MKKSEDELLVLLVRAIMWVTLLLTLYGIVFWNWHLEGVPRFVLR